MMQTLQLNETIYSEKTTEKENLNKSCVSWRDIQGLTWLLVDDY